MKTFSIKKLSIYLVLGIAILVNYSCEKGAFEEESLVVDPSVSLISPQGKQLATSHKELIDMYKATGESKKDANRIDITEIRYAETADYSFGVVDMQVDGNLNSMLVIMEVSKGVSVLSDGNGIRFVKIDNGDLEGIDSKSVLQIEDSDLISPSNEIQGKTKYICNGDCCGWSSAGDDAYNCGCPSTTSLILTTSDDCKIQVVTE
ncbi:MAG: hypothetical protein ACI85I_000693 [Arenicella sp.]|jgi:hypothetical protein